MYISTLIAEKDYYIHNLLHLLATEDPTIASRIRQAYDSRYTGELTNYMNFSIKANVLWYPLFKAGPRPGEQDDKLRAGFIIDDIENSIDAIRDEASKPGTLFASRRSALETLRKIAKMVCCAPGKIGRAVRYHFRDHGRLEHAMRSILRGMTEKERKDMCEAERGGATFLWKMEELEGLAEEHRIWERIGKVIKSLCSGIVEQSDGEDSEDIGSEEEVYESPDEEKVPAKRKHRELTQVTRGYHWSLGLELQDELLEYR